MEAAPCAASTWFGILSWGLIHRSFLTDGTQDRDLMNFVRELALYLLADAGPLSSFSPPSLLFQASLPALFPQLVCRRTRYIRWLITERGSIIEGCEICMFI
ncbi:hypothetical protein BJX76DRAFT_75123 [Aspergillus varians]